MKKVFFLGFVFCLILAGCATGTNNPGVSAVSMDIKMIAPVPMVAPTENEEAMQAYNIGTQRLYENRLDEAERYLKQAIDLDPLFVDAMDHLGIVYRRQNRLAEAEEMYLKSIGINKENKVPYQNLAVVYRLQNRLGEAFELYRTLVQLDENGPEGYYGMGEIFFTVGDFDNAMVFFDIAIQLYINQNSAYVYDAFYYKGMILYYQDKYEEALMYLQEARKGNPNNATIENTINEIRRMGNL